MWHNYGILPFNHSTIVCCLVSELWLWIVKQHWHSTFNRIWWFCDPIWPICNQIWPVCDLVWSICDPIWPICDPIWPFCNPIWPFFDPIRPFCDPIGPFCDPTRPFCDRIWPICDPMWPCLGPIWLFLGLYSWSGLNLNFKIEIHLDFHSLRETCNASIQWAPRRTFFWGAAVLAVGIQLVCVPLQRGW